MVLAACPQRRRSVRPPSLTGPGQAGSGQDDLELPGLARCAGDSLVVPSVPSNWSGTSRLARRTVIAIEGRDGQRVDPGNGQRRRTLVTIRAGIRLRGDGRAVLVGHSRGGATAGILPIEDLPDTPRAGL